jgi:hypothetical protein
LSGIRPAVGVPAIRSLACNRLHPLETVERPQLYSAFVEYGFGLFHEVECDSRALLVFGLLHPARLLRQQLAEPEVSLSELVRFVRLDMVDGRG